MKSIKEIMTELGFSPGASEGTQRAFIRHLLKIATDKERLQQHSFEHQKVKKQEIALNCSEKTTKTAGQKSQTVAYEQLSFDFDEKKQVS